MRLDITGQSNASGKHAFVETLTMEMEKLKDDLAMDVGRQSYGEGLGILAVVSTDSCATAISVKNRFFAPGHNGGRYVSINQLIDVGTVANSDELTSATGATVMSIATSKNSGTTSDVISISASIDTITACGHFVFNFGAGGAGLEIKGLRAIVDDVTQTNIYANTGGFYKNATIFGVDRNTTTGWNANVDANSGVARIMDGYLLQKNFDSVRKASGKDPEIVFAEYDTVSAFVDSVAGDRRYASPNFDVARETITFNGKTFVKDLLAPYDEMYLLRKDAVQWYTLLDFEFADDDGILKNVSGYDRWEAFLRGYIALAPERPNALGCVRDIRCGL